MIALRERVRMEHDAEVEAAYPRRWIGKVEVLTTDGRTLSARVDEPKGDPGNTLSRDEVIDKALRLAAFADAATADEVRVAAARIFALAEAPQVGTLLASVQATTAAARRSPARCPTA